MRRNQASPITRLFTTVATILLATVIAITLAEWAASAILKSIRTARPLYMLSYTDDEIKRLYGTDDPKRYHQALIESWRYNDTVYSPFVEYRMTPFQGSYLTITEEGYRSNGRGAQDLGRPGPKVFVFGGSTTLGSGVIDNETIPAYLEEALRAGGVADAQVFNFGVVSWYSTQERILFERMLTAGQKPDVAVFIDGLNDFYQCQIPDVSAWYERLMQITRGRSRMPLMLEIVQRSNVVQLARHLGGDRSVVLRETGAFCDSDEDVDKVIHRLDTNRRMIAAIADKLGFKAVFVQQPVPTYHYDNSKRVGSFKIEMLGYHQNSGKGYPRMAKMREDGRLFTDNLLWLAELEPPGDANAYVDTVHYSPLFNKAIAQSVADHILAASMLGKAP